MTSTYAQRDYPDIPAIQRIGVIGAGQMGGGIVQVAAQAGFDVRLMDVSRQALEAALGRIDFFLSRQVSKGVLSEEAKSGALSRISIDEGWPSMPLGQKSDPRVDPAKPMTSRVPSSIAAWAP